MSVYNVYHLEYLIIIYDPVFRPRGPSSGLSFFGLFREPRPGPGGPRVCVGDASCVSSSPDFPARLRVVALFFLSSFLAPFLVSFLLCLFLFFLRSACRGVVLAGCAHDRTVSAAGRASAFFSSSRRFFCAFFSARSPAFVPCTAER